MRSHPAPLYDITSLHFESNKGKNEIEMAATKERRGDDTGLGRDQGTKRLANEEQRGDSSKTRDGTDQGTEIR